MKHRIFSVVIAAGVLLFVFALSRNNAFGQSASPLPDTTWIEAHVVAQNPDPATNIVKAPDSVGSNAAILAAQILLYPIQELGVYLPIILR